MNCHFRDLATVPLLACIVLVVGSSAAVEVSDANTSDGITLVGDGKTDNTVAFTKLMGSGGRSLEIAPGDYVLGKVAIPSGTTLTLDSGVTLIDSGRLGPEDRLLTIAADNVHISGAGAKIVANRSNYLSGEQRHGVFIWGAHNVYISGLESSGHGGDGFYIGGPAGRPSSAILLDHVTGSNNRRQGLSITSAEDVEVIDSTFAGTYGTSPEFGVDIEPNGPGDVVRNIKLRGLHTSNNRGGGLLIELLRLNSTSSEVSITVDGHRSKHDGVSLAIQGAYMVPGVVVYRQGASSNALRAGVRLVDPFAGGVRTEIDNLTVTDSNASGIDDAAIASAIVVRRRANGVASQPFGGVYIRNARVLVDRGKPVSQYAVWIQGPKVPGEPWKGLHVENLTAHGLPLSN